MEAVFLSKQELGCFIRSQLREVLTELEEKKLRAEKEDRVKIQTLDIKEAAKFLNISTSRLYIKAGNGEIKNFKRGNRIFFFEEDLLNYILNGERHSQQEIDSMADESLIKP